MADPKPKLVAVGSEDDTGAAEPAPRFRRRATDFGVGFWILAVILVAAAVIIGSQTRRIDRLAAQVETLESELGAAHGALRGYESRFGEIRESVGALREQLGELEGLVEQSPASESTR